MSSTDHTQSRRSDPPRFGPGDRSVLLAVARDSIRHGVETGRPLRVHPEDFPQVLRAPGASFVTLHRNGRLRGCIGSLEPWRPLVQDVAENAFAAAFRDPRFPPLGPEELEDLDIHISVLSAPEELEFDSEEDLVRKLQPGRDGLILQDGTRKGTFLPSVWEELPDPRQFLTHLKLKAGLPPDHWSDSLRVWRYGTESFDRAA
ncbi:MAG TPA: AmmeMemoRadiSam system protein A [Chromatiales bacterium]|nr:AmmeMemoRadiSam system protein A [Chromatiales bacterium]